MSAGTAVVVGLGRSGAACARVLDAEGYRVRVVDSGDSPALRVMAEQLPPSIEVTLGGYRDDVVEGAAIICPSPAVPWDAPILEGARARGIPVRSEIDLVFERCHAPIVGITGTNGKTTTTALTGAIIAAGGARTHVGGNIGDTMLDRLHLVGPEDWVVLELSSFQLESARMPRCRLATVLNVTPDHLDRHGSFTRYLATKRRIVECVDGRGVVVLNAGDATMPPLRAASAAPVRLFGDSADVGANGATVRHGTVVSVEAGFDVTILPVDDIPLFGAHNVANVLAATCLGRAAGVAPDQIAGAVRGFRAVAHRLQTVLDRDGILWVDDSKATNAESAVVALRSFGERPIVWVGGGRTKGVGPDMLAAEVSARARCAIVNGETAVELDRALVEHGCAECIVVTGLRDAVVAAHAVARRGDVVLLSPGYTSFDQFSSFEERGDAFARWVHEIAGAEQREPAGTANGNER